MSEENISIFRQELERVKTQFEDKFQDIMASVRADRENDKRTLQMVNENINNDRKAINQNRALNDKLETLLNVQNTMLSELRSMNNSIKDLSGGGGGGMGLMGAALAGLGGAGIASIFGGGGDTNVDGGDGNDRLRYTGGGDYPNPNRRITGDGPGAARDGDNLFSFISQGEGGYSASNRGTSGNRIVGSTQNTTRNNKNLEDMTFREIMELQNIRNPNDPNRLFAVGAYQIIPSTLAEIFPHSGLDLDDKFTPENQDRLAELLLLGNPETGYTKRPRLAAYLRGESDNIEEAMLDFAKEWASAPDPRTGKSYYGSGNRASHSIEEVRNALLDARRNFEESGSIIPQSQEEESDAERVRGEPIPLDQIVTGGLKTNVANEETGRGNLFHTKHPSRGTPHNETYRDYSMGTRIFWDELPEGLSEGQNTRTLTDPKTGESFESTFYVIPHPSGQGYTTTQMLSNDETGLRLRNSLEESRKLADQLGGRTPTFVEEGQLADNADVKLDLFGHGLGPGKSALANQEEIDLSESIEASTAPAYKKPEEDETPIEGVTPDPIVSGDGRETPEEELITPGPDDVLIQTFRGSGQWYKRPDGSRYLLQFGKIIREIPANDAELSTDGSGDDTLEQQDTSSFDFSGVGDVFDENGNRVVPQDNNNILDLSGVVGEQAVPQNDVSGSRRERIRRDQEQEQEETPTFPTLADQFMSGESPTSMDLAPAVEDALRPDLPEPPTEEDPEETTSGGYTGGGGGSREQEQPQIEANAIGRFPWAEKIIKYYNLSDMIKTNMLS